jgi:hypothetical protein
MFEKLGGLEVGAMARRRLFEGPSDKASLDTWLRIAFLLYTRRPRDPNVVRRAVGNPERYFSGSRAQAGKTTPST